MYKYVNYTMPLITYKHTHLLESTWAANKPLHSFFSSISSIQMLLKIIFLLWKVLINSLFETRLFHPRNKNSSIINWIAPRRTYPSFPYQVPPNERRSISQLNSSEDEMILNSTFLLRMDNRVLFRPKGPLKALEPGKS